MDVQYRLLGALLGLALACGCQIHEGGLHGGKAGLNNPLFIPSLDREFLWSQVVDAVDNHFKIRREVRVRQIGDTLLEGRIDTYPTDGSTLLEPWRKDSTHGFEKLHSTLQSTSRQATLRVTPVEGGFLIDVAVEKYVEDVTRPQNSTSSRDYAHPDVIDGDDTEAPPRNDTMGWIRIGRDASLEQKILGDIRARVTQ